MHDEGGRSSDECAGLVGGGGGGVVEISAWGAKANSGK